MPKGNVDPRAVSTRVEIIDGEEYVINVMPPSPEEHDEMTWRFRKPNTFGYYEFEEYHSNAPSGLLDVGFYRADHAETFASL